MTNRTPDAPDMREKCVSQIPAIHLLTGMGWTLLSAAESDRLRGGKRSSVLLTAVLEKWLRNHNRIEWKGQSEPFSEANIEQAIRHLTDAPFHGLMPANQDRTDRLLLGATLTQTVAGDTKSFPLCYIDWNRPTQNTFHVVPEFAVRKSGQTDDCEIDLVLFVNGIPLATIECKSPTEDTPSKSAVDKAVEQTIRNWGVEYIPQLFGFSQMTLAVAVNEAKYATAGTPKRYWAIWRDKEASGLTQCLAQPASRETITTLKSIPEFEDLGDEIQRWWPEGGREPTKQDETLYGLCRPDRFLELCSRYTLFDAGKKKIARYQQYFCVEELLRRVQKRNPNGSRKGGVIWHTQGSGKSLTMVMFARALAEELPLRNAPNFRIVLVTDRVDLDEQIGKTFANCGLTPVRAMSGKHLAKLLVSPNGRVITTIVDKFKKAASVGNPVDDPDVFVLVDEGHRTHFGELHALMEKKLPRACMLAFTGTPVKLGEQSTADKFGGIADIYTIKQANEDSAVVPLIYEGREVPQKVDSEAIDRWFDRVTADLSEKQKSDLKKKYARAGVVTKAEERIATIAYDIGRHFRDTWQGTGFKGQLVAPDRATAVRYQRYLTEFGGVTSELLISAPDDREGEDGEMTGNEEDKALVREFWSRMMERFGDPETYQRQLINSFKYGGDPEIIVVVHKLLTGFDAPRNTVLYLDRKLEDHTLLQAIARVNRLEEGKDAGYIIDYVGVMEDFDRAIRKYSKLENFDPKMLEGAVRCVSEDLQRLPDIHADLWALFVDLRNTDDPEQYQQSLANQPDRDVFYARLSDFSRTLGIALSSVTFHEQTNPKTIEKYKKDLRFFQLLRRDVQRRYQETVAFGDYEGRIKKLIDRHVGAGEVEIIVPQLRLFDDAQREAELARLGSDSGRADAMASAMKRVIDERFGDDPAFYRRFSEMLKEVISEWRTHRLSDAAYLERVRGLLSMLDAGTVGDVPARLRNRDVAQAYHGIVRQILNTAEIVDAEDFCIEVALAVDNVVGNEPPVDWVKNDDFKNRIRQEIDDVLFDLKEQYDVPLPLDQMDEICEECLRIAERRRAR